MLEIRKLTKRFGSRTVVDELTLAAGKGEVYGFLGHNGAGKTTTIRMLLGVLQPDSGSAQICGRDVRRGDRAGRQFVGAVGEIQHFYPDMTCLEYLSYFAAIFGVERSAERVAEVLDDVGLLGRESDRAIELSKGLQQKLGLARALLHDPPVLILDEPVSGLDPQGIRDVREIILRERTKGRLVFFSSHVLSEVERIADRIGIMRSGRLVFEESIDVTMSRFSSLEEAFINVTSGASPLMKAAQ